MSFSDVGTGPAYKQPSSATKQNTSSSNKTSITQKKDNLKFTDMKISVSSNSQGAKYSKSCKVTSKVILPKKRKAPSRESLKYGRRRVARTARQEERKMDILLLDKAIKKAGGGGEGGEMDLLLERAGGEVGEMDLEVLRGGGRIDKKNEEDMFLLESRITIHEADCNP
jgi:hypothetical protein